MKTTNKQKLLETKCKDVNKLKGHNRYTRTNKFIH